MILALLIATSSSQGQSLLLPTPGPCKEMIISTNYWTGATKEVAQGEEGMDRKRRDEAGGEAGKGGAGKSREETGKQAGMEGEGQEQSTEEEGWAEPWSSGLERWDRG
jgi:hypothetical protein